MKRKRRRKRRIRRSRKKLRVMLKRTKGAVKVKLRSRIL